MANITYTERNEIRYPNLALSEQNNYPLGKYALTAAIDITDKIEEIENSPRKRISQNKVIVEFHLLDQLRSFVEKLVEMIAVFLSGREGEKIPVWAYSNCTDVELFVDGVSYGKQSLNSFDHGAWEVEYHPAKLEVVGYICSERVAYDCVETTGKPVALKLRAENMPDVHAGCGDIALFTCYCVDSEGRCVPDAAPFVRFNCNGIGQIVGTGSDVADSVPLNIPARQMRAGAVSIAVRVGDNEGKLVLYATDLTAAELK